MIIYNIDRCATINQTLQNLMEAGVLLADEYEKYSTQLYTLDSKDLIAVLLESWRLRELVHEESPNLTKFYLIDMSNISMN